MPRKEKRIPVSERALIQRINRVLIKRDEYLCVARGGRVLQEYGHYYTVDLRRNQAVQGDVDLEPFGRELGCLKEWEYLGRRPPR